MVQLCPATRDFKKSGVEKKS